MRTAAQSSISEREKAEVEAILAAAAIDHEGQPVAKRQRKD